jgi:signal transduction histidine kinase
MRNRVLVKELQESNEELLAQKEELHQNSEELQQIADQLKTFNDSLEGRVAKRTQELQQANERLERQQEELRTKNGLIEEQKREVERALEALKQAQTQMVQSEKMASLGLLTAGIAHELNNPINYINSGIVGLKMALQDVLDINQKYEEINTNNADKKLAEIGKMKENVDFDELIKGIEELTNNIYSGAERTAEIVKGLRTFSRLDESSLKMIDLHENIDTTLVMLRNQYKNSIDVVRIYGNIPKIECFPGKLNQVFMNLLVNSIQAIEDKAKKEYEKIIIRTSTTIRNKKELVRLEFEDTGGGIPPEVRARIFEPFFTTKEVGKGTGLGLSISLSIVEEHHGWMEVETRHGVGTLFIIHLPIMQN